MLPEPFLCDCGCSGRHTMDAIFEILMWDLQALYKGAFPAARHDGKPWGPTDKSRASRRRELGFRGALLQVRGDWMWYKQVMGFPSWTSSRVCWKCEASDGGECDWRDFSAKAGWRKRRLSAEQFCRQMRENGVEISSLFSAPEFKLSMCCIDVLHALDLGAAQDAVGNIFWEALEKLMVGVSSGLNF